VTFHPDELRGFHGRWSKGGGWKKVDRSDVHESIARRRAQVKVGARGRKSALTGQAREVHTAFDQRAAGRPLTVRQQHLTEHAATQGQGSFWDRMRQANADRASGIAHPKTRRESLSTARTVHEADYGGLHVGRGGARTGVKQSFAGKAVAVRGRPPVAMKSAKKPARTLMPKPPTGHQQYTRKQLALKTDAWMRDQLKARGIAIPKGARTRVLTDLLAGGS
jgi:hypothetical protein